MPAAPTEVAEGFEPGRALTDAVRWKLMLIRFLLGIQKDLVFRPGFLAPQVGLEPTTLRLTAECSAIELLRTMESGGDLLSRTVTSQVPSALKGLTSVFGMGTGVTPSLSPPEMVNIFRQVRSVVLVFLFACLLAPLYRRAHAYMGVCFAR